MRMTSESGRKRRGELGGGRRGGRKRIGQQIDRGDDGQEIDDAPPPDRASDDMLLGLFAVTRGAGAFIFRSVRPDDQVVRRHDPLVIGQYLIDRRQCDRRIEMRVDTDPLEHALMDLRDRDLHAIPLVGGKFRVRKRGHAPWPVSVVTAQSVSRIVDAAVLVLGRSYPRERVGIGSRRRLQGEAAAARFGQHPGERHMGERVIRISAADIGMHAGEPDLGDPF